MLDMLVLIQTGHLENHFLCSQHLPLVIPNAAALQETFLEEMIHDQ